MPERDDERQGHLRRMRGRGLAVTKACGHVAREELVLAAVDEAHLTLVVRVGRRFENQSVARLDIDHR